MMSFAKVRDYCPTANRMADWAFVDNMTTVLKPLATLTTQMQATQYIAGDFFRDYIMAMMELDRIIRKSASRPVVRMATKLKASMKKREKAFDTPALNAALYLDPRFNNNQNSNPQARMTINQRKSAIVSISIEVNY